MNEIKTEEKLNPQDYYLQLDYASKMLFKREVLKRLEWSAKTFHRRMAEGDYRPGEILIINEVITTKSFLNV